MSPEMLTLVAAVLAYDIARDTCDFLSSAVEAEEVTRAARRSPLASLKDRSWTRLEKDMIDCCREYWTKGILSSSLYNMWRREELRLVKLTR